MNGVDGREGLNVYDIFGWGEILVGIGEALHFAFGFSWALGVGEH
jgi:hypothetical protein